MIRPIDFKQSAESPAFSAVVNYYHRFLREILLYKTRIRVVSERAVTLTLSAVGHAVHSGRIEAAVAVHRALVPVLVTLERVQRRQRRHLRSVGPGVTVDGQSADGNAAGLVRVTRRDRVVQRLQLLGATLAGRYEHDHCDQHGAADGRAGRDRYPVHVARHRHRRADLPTLAVRHRVRSDVNLLQRYHANYDAFLWKTAISNRQKRFLKAFKNNRSNAFRKIVLGMRVKILYNHCVLEIFRTILKRYLQYLTNTFFKIYSTDKINFFKRQLLRAVGCACTYINFAC